MDQDLLYALLAVGIMLVIGFPVHEFSHAFAAYRLGDSTARWQGRLTLDPRVHFDPVGGLMLAITSIISQGSWFFGYARPTPVNPMNLQGGRRGEALVAFAGPLSNLVMAAIVAIPLRLVYGSDALLMEVIGAWPLALVMNVAFYFVLINVFLCIFNLLPVPPLDGWKVLGGLVPSHISWQMRRLEQQYAMIIPVIFLGFIFIGGSRVIGPIASFLLDVLLGDRYGLLPVIR
ncbi:MAG: site-2 protease family protein [Chloroflexi bacterium]|nr:site-2 protease family protein [Chloroflexota bacterium]